MSSTMEERDVVLIRLLLMIFCFVHTAKADAKTDAQTSLEYVERIGSSAGACAGGTGNVLTVEFDNTIWDRYAQVAVNMANLLTRIVLSGNNSLGHVSEEFLFSLVLNNVDSNGTLIFGSAIAVEPFLFPSHQIYCPYAYDKDVVRAHDIATSYDYLSNDTEWYHTLRIRNWTTATVTSNYVTYRPEQNVTVLRQPVARLEDGHWTKPYFDCGGGDIWMVTYSSPVFGMDDEALPLFLGIGTIDIELTQIDINQCDVSNDTAVDGAEENAGSSVDVFRGTHKCRSTTVCVPIKGSGFRVGSYRCICQIGYYFPEVDIPEKDKGFEGSDIETYYASAGNTSNSSLQAVDSESVFRCRQCAEGCDSCIDDSPCLYSYIWGVRTILLILDLVILTLAIGVSILVAVFRQRRIIKSASPMFLQVMAAGAALMCCPMLISFGKATKLTCTLQIWPRHIGFWLMYGAMLLKTWRISVIFKVKSARKLNVTDRVLAQRLAIIIAVVIIYLIVWMVMGDIDVEWKHRDADNLKFTDCKSGVWDIGSIFGEILFLLWGCYLCFSVRKAPSQFNESKFITWSIYNTVLLGSFILIIRFLIAPPLGPDVIYLADFIYYQVVVTCTALLIFVPKFHIIRTVGDMGGAEPEEQTNKAAPAGTTLSSLPKDVQTSSTQTDLTGVSISTHTD